MSLILEALERARKDKDVPDPVEVARVLAHQKMARRPRRKRTWPLIVLLLVVVSVTAAAGVAVVHYFLGIYATQRAMVRTNDPAAQPVAPPVAPAVQELPVAGPANLAPTAMPVAGPAAVSDQLPPPMPLAQPQPPPFGVYAPTQPGAPSAATPIAPPPNLATAQTQPLQPATQPAAASPPVANPAPASVAPATLEPAAPAAVAEPTGGARVNGGFSLGTILYDKNMRIAVINGQMVHEGQKTDEFSVLKITPNTVTVQKPGQAPITLRTN